MGKLSFYLVAAILALSLIFAGCAQPSPSSTAVAPPKTSSPPSSTAAPAAPTTASSAAPAAKAIELKFADFLPPVSIPIKDVAVPWAAKLGTSTNGRVKVTLFPAESLAKTADMYDAVQSGMADIVHIDIGITDVFPLTAGLCLPLMFNNDEASSATFMELVDKYLQNTELKNMKVLWTINIPPSNIETNKKQIKTLEDLKGVKLAVTSQMAVRTLTMLGATPVVMPIVEHYTALDRGMVDGQVECWPTAKTFKITEVTKYRTNCNLWTSATLVAMNLNSWNNLPPDIKEIFKQNTGVEFSRNAGAIFDASSKDIVENVIAPYDKEKGNPGIYNLPDTEKAKWVQAIQPLRAQWIAEREAKGMPAKAFVNDMLEIAKKYQK